MRWPWKRDKRVLNSQQEARLVEAIRRAEQGNRGEVLVHVERRSSRALFMWPPV